jgi:VWFA-related protein
MAIGKARLRAVEKQVFQRGASAGCLVLLASILVSLTLFSAPLPQSSEPAAAPATQTSDQNAPEIASHDETPTFQVKVNLVEVRVVVRDAKGNAIGNLKQGDFQLLDNGKPQIISKFSVEKAGTAPIIHEENAGAMSAEKTTQPATAAVVPQRYVAYLFDDIHLNISDLMQARNAAARQLQALQPSDRAAIFTTSGQNQLDFTDDRAQLAATLNRLMPRPISSTGLTPCPDISYYLADLIINRNDAQARQTAVQDDLDCNPVANAATAGAQVDAAAREKLSEGGQELRISLGVLRDIVRRIAALPGDRIIVLVSPGFMNPDELPMQAEIAERALHSGVVINALDARGLYTNMPDASRQRYPGPQIAGLMLQYHAAEQSADANIMADLADTTGGTFFHNNNDLAEGFRRLADQPEYSYLLAFSPLNLKFDGRYHKLKVALMPPAQGTIQARQGYYAPKGATDASEQARQAIEDEVFARDEVREIPADLHTQFFKADENSARLAVLVHIDLRSMHYRKADGRNNDNVTVVAVLFDRNGNFVSGTKKVLQLHLKDETLQTRLNSGVTLKSNFDVKPGSYLVRLVVRDQDGQLATQNTAVEIPQ